MNRTPEQEHPFAPFIRILGKGRKGSRALTEEEAFQAMQMILAGDVEPVQLGAFLMLMRVKEETPEEVAGFVKAARETVPQNSIHVDIDWSSYAGKRRHLPWYLLSALLLAENGYKVVIHGSGGHMPGRLYTRDAWQALNLPYCSSVSDVADSLSKYNIAFIELEKLSQTLYDIIELRPLLGLRSPIHTLCKLLNPFAAKLTIQGIFHPGYRNTHQEAAELLGEANQLVIKGEGGEIERNPDTECKAQYYHEGDIGEELWPAMFPKRHIKEENLDMQNLIDVWQGRASHEYGEAAVIGTTAIIIKQLKLVSNQDEAQELASQWWQQRKAIH